MNSQLAPDEADDAGSPPILASVLIVDDHPANLTTFAAILEPLAVRVVRASSGVEALRCALEEDFAVILMDVRMPGMDGLETAARIRGRRRSSHTPIIFVSASQSDATIIARGYRQGAVDYLLKPFEPEILRSKVAVFVDLYVMAERIKRHEARLRRLTREALEREGEHRFCNLLDALPLSMWAVRTDGGISYGNRWWLDFSGLDRGPGVSVWELDPIHPDDRAPLRAAWEEALRTGRPFELTCRLRRASDGAHLWHMVRAVPERSSEGAITGWVAGATDVDEQKRAAEARLEREQGARREAEERSRMKDEFLAVVSHELRTPLTGILGWARVLRVNNRGAVDPARAVEAIERNARAQARLVDDLLDATRMVSGKLSVEMHPVDLRAVISAALDAVRPTADDKGIALELDLGAELTVEGDAERLQQVCWNLLANSLKFTSPGGRVDVRLVACEGAAELSVHDDGQGIEPSFLPHVFEPFRQADTSTTRAYGGVGLGLALVRHLVELHEGTVSVDSPGRGRGTTFTVRLPALPAEAAERAPAQRAPPQRAPLQRGPPAGTTRLDGVKVLVVEDEADTLALLKVILEGRGAVVQAVASVADALESFHRAQPDIVLSDIAMPHEDGYSLLRRIRSFGAGRGGGVPAAAVTASAEAGKRARRAGFQAQLVKPFEPARLTKLVTRLLRRRSAP